MARDVIISIILREVIFYYVHRLLHHPSIYPIFHKPHHRFTAPVALAAQHATITEHIAANILPIAVPPKLLKSHIVTFWVFLTLELLETTTVHSGYDFLAGSARMHDLHHEKFVVCFGTVGLLDWLHKTDGKNSVGREAEAKTKEQ
jgi:sterol desaturase/sphingolipid hydroxylase (fatty acid hydroxylase superfamily)